MLSAMAQVFAQHANAGLYHLETRYIEPNRWEWYALDALKTSKVIFAGEATTLEAAKQAACAAVGLCFANWMCIGPAIEVPD